MRNGVKALKQQSCEIFVETIIYANGCMAANPTDIPVTIKAIPSITTEPVNMTVIPDSNATFSVIATGTDLQYQWQASSSGSGSWSDLTGFTTQNLTILGATESQFYRCRISSNLCPIYSNTAGLSVELPSIDYLDISEIPDPNNRSLNTSLIVGATAGNVSTTQLGGLSYEIPIYCPPGTNGMQPSLSLLYNSQASDGLLGRGWTLENCKSLL